MIEFISYEEFPDDNYTKELVYIQIDGKRYGYVRKQMQNGNKFWAPISLGVQKNGKKEYFNAFMFDSNFLEKDIKAFLEARSWENKSGQSYIQPAQKFNAFSPPLPDQQSYQYKDENPQQFNDELPF